MVTVIESFVQGLERPIILWLLNQKPMHGYGLIKELKGLTGKKQKPSMIYPFLHWLEDNGFAEGKWVEEDGRNIRCYSLTERGKILLKWTCNLLKRPLKEILTDFLA